MRIRLLVDVPVLGKEGMTVGRELETIPTPEGKDGVWVQGDFSRVRLWEGEYELIKEEEENVEA